MAIYRQLQKSAFEPAEIATMAAAYETTLSKLHLKDRDDPVTELIAQKIIELFDPGELSPDALCQRVIDTLQMPPNATNQ